MTKLVPDQERAEKIRDATLCGAGKRAWEGSVEGLLRVHLLAVDNCSVCLVWCP